MWSSDVMQTGFPDIPPRGLKARHPRFEERDVARRPTSGVGLRFIDGTSARSGTEQTRAQLAGG